MKGLSFATWLLPVVLIAAWPVAGEAQEAVLMGVVTDSTGGVLPGVTVTAVHQSTGNTFESVTDSGGAFRMPVRVGIYQVTAQLQGFQTVTRPGIQLLLGQQVPVNLQMAPAALQETVTVTGEAPLIDTTASTVGTNIDPAQVSELPINGRNWMDLALLAPGARRNESGGLVQNRQGYSQTNVDGQLVTTIYHSNTDGEQVQWSRDAIAEFQVVQNRFDASYGRSAGMLVNAITRSGTNSLAGTVGGYFRSDKFNAEDFVAERVLPYSNQQVSGTLGGPIVRDRLHFFGAYEYEREPKTFVYDTPYPAFNMDLSFTDRAHKPLGRLDYQMTPSARLSARISGYNRAFHVGGGSNEHPINMRRHERIGSQYMGTFTQVLTNRSVNEIKGGATFYERRDQSTVINWRGQTNVMPYHPVLDGGTVLVSVRGFSIGSNPLNIIQNTASIRDDFTTSYDWGGRHDVKMGGEYFRFYNDFRWCLRCMGQVDALGGPVPANLEALFPVWNDPSTWNLQPLTPITRWVYHSKSSTEHTYDVTRHLFAGWAQDDWRVNDRLTLNLGVRYDFDNNGNAEDIEFRPWVPGDLPRAKANFAPRLGVNLRLNDRTVVRGGYGLFFAFQPNDAVQQTVGYRCTFEANDCPRFEEQIFPDGRADFVPNWHGSGPSPEGEWGGPKPTWDQALGNACDVNGSAPRCSYRSLVQEISYVGRNQTPQYSQQAGIGVQRQLSDVAVFEVNFNYTGGRREESSMNGNLTYDPATGANYLFRDVQRRPFPDWGTVNFEWLAGWSNYYGTDFTFTKRYSDNWQMSASYTLSYFKDAYPRRDQWFFGSDGLATHEPIGFALAADMGGDYTYALGDQRHRVTANGIWDLGRGFQVSGIYFYGSGERLRVWTGVDRRGEGGQAPSGGQVGGSNEQRLRGDGSIVPRNDFVGDPIHRVDLRMQQRIPIAGTVRVDGMFEVFNLFNHTNYGSYTTNESNRFFGQPEFNSNIAYWPRVLQLGIRLAF